MLAHDLAQQYIDRNSDEIASLTAEHRVGRPKNGKLVMLEMLRGKDKQEYNVGMSTFLCVFLFIIFLPLLCNPDFSFWN